MADFTAMDNDLRVRVTHGLSYQRLQRKIQGGRFVLDTPTGKELVTVTYKIDQSERTVTATVTTHQTKPNQTKP